MPSKSKMTRRARFLIALGSASFFIGSYCFWLCEIGINPNLHTAFDAVWWWFVTTSTVGYGDLVAVTTSGRLVSIVTIIIGIYLYVNAITMISDRIHSFLEAKKQGVAQVKVRGHIVICEYTAIADELIQSLPYIAQLKDRAVVTVTDLVQTNPYPEHYYVKGVPINPACLQLANIAHAEIVFIFANFRFSQPDIKTLHIASRVKKANPKATVFVEMVDVESPYLKESAPDLIPMKSEELTAMVIRGERLDPYRWVKTSADG